MTDLLEPHVHRLLCLDTFLTQTVFTSERNPLSGWEWVLASGNISLSAYDSIITEKISIVMVRLKISPAYPTQKSSTLSLSPRAREAFLMEGVAKS